MPWCTDGVNCPALDYLREKRDRHMFPLPGGLACLLLSDVPLSSLSHRVRGGWSTGPRTGRSRSKAQCSPWNGTGFGLCVCIGDSNPPRPTRYASHSSVTLSESNVTYLSTKGICWTKLMKTNTPNYEKEKEGHTGNQGLRKNCLEQFSRFLQSTARQLRFSWWTVLSPASIWSVSVSH